MIDSHCHLDRTMYGSEEEIESVLARGRLSGIDHCVTIGSGSGFDGAKRAIQLSKKHSDVVATVGIHPLEATEDTKTLLSYRSLFEEHDIAACGEMGLDYFRNSISPEIQRICFRTQIGWAKELALPIIIHDRESKGEVLSILLKLDAFSSTTVLYHCFTGSVEYMRDIVDTGGYISIPGIVTFKKALVMKQVSKEVPLDRLLIETDSPFLTPKPHRGKRNEPRYIRHTAEYIAHLRGVSVEELVFHTDNNARNIFGIDSAE